MAISTVSKSFTAVGVGTGLAVKHGDKFTYAVSGTFVGTVVLEYTRDGGASFQSSGISATGAASGTVFVETPDLGAANYRFRCSAFTSGTIVTSLVDANAALVQEFKDINGNTILSINESGIVVTGTVTNSGGEVAVATNSNAAAGVVGEFKSQDVTINDVAGATGTFENVASVSLEAGDWEVRGGLHCVLNGATMTGFSAAISIFSADTTTDHVSGKNVFGSLPPTASISLTKGIPPYRISLAAITTVYLKSNCQYSAGTPRILGSIAARRIR